MSPSLFPGSETHPEYVLCKLCHPIIYTHRVQRVAATSYRKLVVACWCWPIRFIIQNTHTVFGWHCGWCSWGTMRITDSIILGWPKSPSMFVDTYLAFVGLTFRGQYKSKSSRDEWLNMYRDHVSQLGLAMSGVHPSSQSR